MCIPPRAVTVISSATATIISAAQLHQRTLRPNSTSTSGAMIRISPRISNWMNGMLTPLNVNDSGTVNSTNPVPSPDTNVARVGQGMRQPAIERPCASRCQPDSQMNR